MPEDKPPQTPPADTDLPPKVGGVPSSRTPTSPPEAWNIDADGKVFGPYSRQQMRELIADGRLSASSKVARTGQMGWKRADDDPLLKRLLAGNIPLDETFSAHSDSLKSTALLIEAKLVEEKSTILAIILGLLLPGLGQMYVGQILKGVITLIVCIISLILLGFIIVGYIIAFILYVWAIVDGYNHARHLNAARQAAWLKQRGL